MCDHTKDNLVQGCCCIKYDIGKSVLLSFNTTTLAIECFLEFILLDKKVFVLPFTIVGEVNLIDTRVHFRRDVIEL